MTSFPDLGGIWVDVRLGVWLQLQFRNHINEGYTYSWAVST